jgi:uncharacterized membrane-anchored protein
MFAALIAAVTIAYYVSEAVLGAAHRRMASIAVLAFWIAYVLTRPLGASLGDYFSQAPDSGGLGAGYGGNKRALPCSNLTHRHLPDHHEERRNCC